MSIIFKKYFLPLAPAKPTDSDDASKNSLPLSQATSLKSGTVLLFYQIMIHCKLLDVVLFSCGVELAPLHHLEVDGQ